MTQYIAVVDKDPDSAYGVYFPDLDGCFSGADEIEDLFTNAMEGLSLYLDFAEERPEARTVEQLLKDPELTAAFQRGAFLVNVPYRPGYTAPSADKVELDDETLALIDAAAEERKLSRSAFLGYAARQVVEKNL